MYLPIAWRRPFAAAGRYKNGGCRAIKIYLILYLRPISRQVHFLRFGNHLKFQSGFFRRFYRACAGSEWIFLQFLWDSQPGTKCLMSFRIPAVPPAENNMTTAAMPNCRNCSPIYGAGLLWDFGMMGLQRMKSIEEVSGFADRLVANATRQ